MNEETFISVNPPKPTWMIKFGSVTIFHDRGKVPNRFQRWMYWALLGWKVEAVE